MTSLWGVAQMVERRAVNADVAGSSPAPPAMNFIAQDRFPTGAMKSPAANGPPVAAGDTYYGIAEELLQITDQFEILRRALIHAVDMTEQEKSEPLDLAFALLRASARRIQEVSVRCQGRLRDDDLDSATLVYGENQ